MSIMEVRIVIASAAKQSQHAPTKMRDCFAALAKTKFVVLGCCNRLNMVEHSR